MIKDDLENIKIPDNIDDSINKGIDKIKKERLKTIKKKYLKICSILAILLISGTIFNSTLTNASENNIFGSIFKYFESKTSNTSKISDIATNINETVKSNNLAITIDSVACDNNYISISYKIINDKSFNLEENDIHKILFQGYVKNINSEKVIPNYTEKFSLIDENTLLVTEKYNAYDLFDNIIPDNEFKLEINLDSIDIVLKDKAKLNIENSIEKIKGNWKFKIPVKKDLSKSTNMNINNIITNGTKIENIEITPYEMKITVKRDSSLPKAIIVFKDSNGNILEAKSGQRINEETFIQTLELPSDDIEYLTADILYLDEIHNDTCTSCNDDGTHSHEIKFKEKIYIK